MLVRLAVTESSGLINRFVDVLARAALPDAPPVVALEAIRKIRPAPAPLVS
jgi:hypothetical protein